MNQNVFRSREHCQRHHSNDRAWSALDPDSRHPLFCNDESAEIEQEATQLSSEVQISEELIFIKDSCNINVITTDTKTATSLQQALQTAIAMIIRIRVNDIERADIITQELLQSSRIKQVTRQKTIIENSRDVDVRTTDSQVATNIQLLMQILMALIVEMDII